MLTDCSKVPSEAKKIYFFPAKNPVDARRREVVHCTQRRIYDLFFVRVFLMGQADSAYGSEISKRSFVMSFVILCMQYRTILSC